MEPIIGVVMPFGGGTAAGFANKKACDEYKEWMSNARDKIRQAQQILRECNCSFTLTVNNVNYSPERMVSFVSGAMSEVAGRLGGSSQVEMQREKIIVRYIPPSRQLP
jgi:hypothetical protein